MTKTEILIIIQNYEIVNQKYDFLSRNYDIISKLAYDVKSVGW